MTEILSRSDGNDGFNYVPNRPPVVLDKSPVRCHDLYVGCGLDDPADYPCQGLTEDRK